MKLERPNYFSDEDLQMELLYGPEGEYKETHLNFWTDIYPNILELYISNNEPDNGYKDIYTDENSYPLGLDELASIAIRSFTSVFPACFKIDFTKLNPKSISDEDINSFKDSKGLIASLARIYHKFGISGKLNIKYLILIIQSLQYKTFELTELLPHSLYDAFIKEIRTPFYMLADATNVKEIRTEIDNFQFIENPKAIKCPKKQKGYRIQKAEYAHSVIILENINFGKKNQEFLWDLLSFAGGFATMETIFFLNCRFCANYISNKESMTSRVVFRNCLFEKEFAPSVKFTHSWKIINSTILGKLDFRKSVFSCGLYIIGCRFNRESSLLLDGINFEYNSNIHKLLICDTIFAGTFSMTRAHCLKSKMSIKNVSFLQPFYIDGTLLPQKSTFENIAFALNSNPQMITSKKVFSRLLLQAGFIVEVEILGLSTQSETNTKHTMDYYAEYRSGWFNPKNASLYLSKSKSWLAKKRIADRKKETKTSIPFVGHLKGILYPKRALEAYRTQDWNTLHQECKKYGIGIQGKPELERPEEDVIKLLNLNHPKTNLKRQSSETD